MIDKTYQEGGEMIDTGKYIDEAMNLYLKELPEDSETAKAIRRGAALSEISQTAEKEGLHYISAGIFIAEEERFAKIVDPGISDVVAARVQEIRKHLPNSCDTAAAIDVTMLTAAARHRGGMNGWVVPGRCVPSFSMGLTILMH